MLEEILQIGVFPDPLQRMIDTEFCCHTEQALQAAPEVRNRIRAIITRSNCTVPIELLDSLPSLQVIATSGVGYDGIPVDYARARGIIVTNTPGVLDAAVCELGIGLLLALLRDIPAADRHVRDEGWVTNSYPLTTNLAGKTVGIVGYGRIGKGIASRLAPFGVHIVYTGTRNQECEYRYITDLAQMAAIADILFVCCRGGQETRHLINAEVLRALGPDGYLVNISRGTVVDEQALIEALEQRTIRGAALDVFDQEPLENSALTRLPNTVLSPHTASATVETRASMQRLALDNLHAVLGGKMPLTQVALNG